MEEILSDVQRVAKRLKRLDRPETQKFRQQCKQFLAKHELLMFLERINTTTGCFVLLPAEIVMLLCSYMKAEDIFMFSSTCRTLREICWCDAAEPLWQRMCSQIEKPMLPKPEHKSYQWYFLAHRVVNTKNYTTPWITPCTFGNYTGDFVNGRRSGHGVIKKQGKNTFTGQFLHGVRHGWGAYENGVPYVGEFSHGKYHGQGKLAIGSSTYEGTFYYGKFMSGKWSEWKYGAGQVEFEGQHRITCKLKRKTKDGECDETHVDGKAHGEYTVVIDGAVDSTVG
jgi:hypothetical protein